MSKKTEPYRDLIGVSEDELKNAVEMMAEELGIPGSIGGLYSLYEAVLKEREQAIRIREIWKAETATPHHN